MNISQQSPVLPIATVVNPATETLRRDNNQRDIIIKPEAASQSLADKGVGSDKDRNKTTTQNNEQIDFESLRKRAEQESRSIGDGSEKEGQSSSSEDNPKKSATEQDKQTNTNDSNQNEADEKIINELKQRDAEVRAHELAHAAIGGSHTGSPSYTFDTGPDGKKYAVSGEVSVDLSPVSGDPRATIAKMQKVHAAALAPANPSAQDMKVAATATKAIAQAQSDILAAEFNQTDTKSSNNDPKINDRFSSNNDNEVNLEQQSTAQSKDFDVLISQTLASQEAIAPTRSQDVDDRASRIESFYSSINNAYEKAPSFQFELTA